MGSKTVQSSAVDPKEVIEAYWRLEKSDEHTVNRIYDSLTTTRKTPTARNEVEVKIKIMRILEENGVEPSQTINQPFDEVAQQIALRLRETMGSNRVGNLLGVPYRRIDELFGQRQIRLDAIKWERRLSEKVKETEQALATERREDRKRELLSELNRINLQLENIRAKKGARRIK
ncbi:MAG: hypothetical protein KGH59_04635 [Candidatus Micrarchaeota archaeon]|nr:hypothetical protein [Candidatus Micrarchaeota archaeon]MDE1805036.1 hypothetical protein [Candidatus Micrarchaeota archaeon]MDE1828039.1 hypothetical protein [Candidatus Micrarchaeota archaeon]